MSKYYEQLKQIDETKQKIAALNERGAAMTAAEIRTALSFNFTQFGKFVVIRRVSSGGKTRTFSEVTDVFTRFDSPAFGLKPISPRSGWTVEKAARFIVAELAKTEEKAEAI